MSKPIDERIAEKFFSYLYNCLPALVCVFASKLLDLYFSWPGAIALSVLIGFGIIGYWIPTKGHRMSFSKHLVFVLGASAGAWTLAYLMTRLGWISER